MNKCTIFTDDLQKISISEKVLKHIQLQGGSRFTCYIQIVSVPAFYYLLGCCYASWGAIDAMHQLMF